MNHSALPRRHGRRSPAAFPLALLLAAGCGGPGHAPEAPQAPMVEAAHDTLAPAPRDGPQVQQLPDGTVMRGMLRDGKRQGVWRSFTADGRLLGQTEFREGRPHGPVVVFRPDGTVRYQGQHDEGTPVGEWRFNDEAGHLERTVLYDSTGKVVDRR